MAQHDDTVLCIMGGHVKVQWEIPNFLDRPIENEEFILSPSFVLNESNWYLQIFPKGAGDVLIGWVSLFLWHCRDPGNHLVSYSFSIEVSGSVIKVFKAENNFNEKSRFSGCHRFIKRSVLENILKGSESKGTLTIICTVRLLHDRPKDAASQTSQLGGLQTLSSNFGELFLGGNQTDVKIKVGEREFNAHKLILKARSPVFSAMLEHNMIESNTGVIKIPDMEAEHVKDLLLYMYTGKTHIVTSTNAVELYKAADKFSLDELKEECKHQMLTEWSVDSVLEVIQLAIVHDENEILRSGSNFLIENAENIISTEKWKLFFRLNPQFAHELMVKTVKSLKVKMINAVTKE